MLELLLSLAKIIPRLDFKNGPKFNRRLPLIPGQNGKEQCGGQEEGHGEAAHGGGKVR